MRFIRLTITCCLLSALLAVWLKAPVLLVILLLLTAWVLKTYEHFCYYLKFRNSENKTDRYQAAAALFFATSPYALLLGIFIYIKIIV